MKENSALERLKNGIITENPTFVLTLGMCPTLAVTTSAVNGLGMGLTTMAVLALSNMFISMLRKVIPDKVRIPDRNSCLHSDHCLLCYSSGASAEGFYSISV